MTEYNNRQWNYNRIQGVYNEFGLNFEGLIRSEYEKSILFEFGKDKESLISYRIQRIVADIKPSILNEWQIRKNSLNNKLEINEIRRILWKF